MTISRETSLGTGLRPIISPLLPIIDARSRVLILGSMPSDISIEKKQYYANPQNHFWTLIYSVLGGGIPPSAYEGRIAFLLSKGVALWDVLEYCERKGSSDASITKVRPNDLSSLLASYPSIRFAFFNGKKAQEIFSMKVALPEEIELGPLPSSSAANAGTPMREKLEKWMAIRAALETR